MPRGKNYVNGNRGVHLQSSRGGSSNMNMCEYGEGCQRSDCIYRHPQDEQNSNNNDGGGRSGGGSGSCSSGGRSGGSGGGGNTSNRRPSNNNNKYHGGGSGSGGSSDLCIPFLAGKCTFIKGCRKRHPSKEDLPRLLAKYKQIRCRFGNDCYTDGCLFSHPKEISSHKKSLEPAFIEPHDFPPLGVVGVAEANGIGNDGGKQQVNNSNSAWNNKNSNSNITVTTTTTTNGLPPNSPAAAPVVGTEAFSPSEKGQVENNNENPGSSSPSASRSSPTQDHQTQQQQSIAPTAWGHVSNGGPPLQQQQQGGGGPMMMNPQQQQLRPPQGPPTPQQAYYGGPPPPTMVAAGPPPPGGVGPGGGGGYPTMIDPNTGYQIQIDPASYYHQMQQQQYQQYPYAAAQFPMGYNNTIPSPQHFFNAEAKEFVPGITFFA